MSYHLIVRNPFGGYSLGARITDATLVTAILADERQKHVVRVLPPQNGLPGTPTPAATQKRTPVATLSVPRAPARSAASDTEAKGQG